MGNKNQIIGAVLIGLLIASFSQSCGAMKGASLAGAYEKPKIIYHPVIPTAFKQADDKLKPKTVLKAQDSIKSNHTASNSSGKLDSLITSQSLMLLNQKISLDNDGKMLDLLRQKEMENQKLKVKNSELKEKAFVGSDVKNDAIIQDTMRQVGLYVLGAIAGVYILLMIFYWDLRRINKKALKNKLTA